MTKRYFGSDGIRGPVGIAPISEDFVKIIGLAIGTFFGQKKNGATARILIGQDTRASGEGLMRALQSGLRAAGAEVFSGAVLPSPAIAWLTAEDDFDAGVVVTASHNPPDHNGIKVFLADGTKPDDATELAIEALITEHQATQIQNTPRVPLLSDAGDRYAQFCRQVLPAETSLSGVKIVLDCAHGASAHIAPGLFTKLGAEVQTLGTTPNGHNINLNCGALHTQAVADKIIAGGAQLGIALDGDGDRAILVDDEGKTLDGDDLLFIAVRNQKLSGKVQDGVVGTVMTNGGLEKAFIDMQIAFARAPVGDRQVLDLMRAKGWQIGGESSGHLLHLDTLASSDGIITALKALHAWRLSGQRLAVFRKGWERVPRSLLSVPCRPESTGQCLESLQPLMEEIQKTLTETGRLLVRASGTEACIRVLVEAPTQEQAQQLAERLASAIAA